MKEKKTRGGRKPEKAQSFIWKFLKITQNIDFSTQALGKIFISLTSTFLISLVFFLKILNHKDQVNFTAIL